MMRILLSKPSILALILLGFLGSAKLQLSSAQQAQDSGADPIQLATKMVNTTREWMDGKQSTPGTSVEVREVARSNEGALQVQYHLFVNGAPKDKTYRIIQWPISAANPSVLMGGLTISEDGLVICAGRTPEQCRDENKKDDPVEFTFSPAEGEIFRLALISADSSAKIFFAIVPNPIIKKSQSCSLEVIRLTRKFELALIRAKGYLPNEDLVFTSKSYDEIQDKKVKADTDGGYVAALLPFVKNKQSGITTLQLKGGGCAPELSFEWGK
jgi:hypothetical protein